VKLVKRARKARKVLTEFDLKDGKKLRIDVLIWGDAAYASEMGYRGNAVYIPLLVNAEGKPRRVYPWKRGVPTLVDLDNFYESWKDSLSDEREKRRLKEVAKTLRELAEEKVCLDSREAHVVYKLLQISRKEPVFTISRLREVKQLSAKMRPALVIEFGGYKFTQPVEEFEYGTLLFNLLKSMKKANDAISQYISEVQHDLTIFVKMTNRGHSEEFPKIRLDDIADEIQKLISKLD
jgi:hypothetical protein